LLFKKKKKLKNRRKLKEHKQAKKIFENKKSFSRIFFLLYSAVKKRAAHCRFPKKNKTKNLFSVGAHSEILACKTDNLDGQCRTPTATPTPYKAKQKYKPRPPSPPLQKLAPPKK